MSVAYFVCLLTEECLLDCEFLLLVCVVRKDMFAAEIVVGNIRLKAVDFCSSFLPGRLGVQGIGNS